MKEFSCGPARNKHAGDWSQQGFRGIMHRYLNETGGFLSGTVEKGKSATATLSFRFHHSTGKLYKEFAFGLQ